MKDLLHAKSGPLPASEGLLKRWLLERQQLLRHFWTLSSLLGQKRAGAAIGAELDRFCEVLVDYVSAGHFEVYRDLLEARERLGRGTPEESATLYALILPTTTAALDFNDRYFRGPAGNSLREDLSALGQLLASRFDWEDALMGESVAARAVA